MFTYSEVPLQLQTELYNEGCRDYIRVLQKYDKDNEADTDNVPPLPSPWHPEPCLLVRKYQQFADRIRDFPVYPDDIWIVTYPKCGTTWAQEMLSASVDINKRSPYLEISSIGSNLHFDSVELTASACTRPRIIKSHLPLNLLPMALFSVNPKLIYVTRNSKDTAISYYHHYRMLLGYKGTLDTFLEAFLAGDLLYGSHTRHTEEFMRLRKYKENVLLLRYEDMKRSMGSVLQQTVAFLRGPLSAVISEPELDELEQHLSFEQMRMNGACNNETMARNAMDMNGRKGEQFHFLRRGQVGTYVEEMPTHFVTKFEAAEERESEELRFYIASV